jgi:CheY-like chemotaxis protein
MGTLMMIAIDDDQQAQEQVRDHCEEVARIVGFDVRFAGYGSVEEFTKAGQQPDVLVVDLRLGNAPGDRSGWDAVRDALRAHVVPVIIYSAYTGEDVQKEFENMLIVRVKKGAERFQKVLEKCSRLKLRLNQEHARVEAQFASLTLETAGKLLGPAEEKELHRLDENALAAMSVARLATYLMNVPPAGQEKLPPEACFVVPPLQVEPYPAECLFLGDFLQERGRRSSNMAWFVAAPSCDLVFVKERKPKIHEVLLLRAYTGWQEVPFLCGEAKESNRQTALSNRARDRSLKILRCPPGVFGCEYLVVSFKEYRTVPYGEITKGIKSGKWTKIATLATPYAEALQNLFVGNLSRIGTPDTSTSDVEDKWIKEFVKNQAGA